MFSVKREIALEAWGTDSSFQLIRKTITTLFICFIMHSMKFLAGSTTAGSTSGDQVIAAENTVAADIRQGAVLPPVGNRPLPEPQGSAQDHIGKASCHRRKLLLPAGRQQADPDPAQARSAGGRAAESQPAAAGRTGTAQQAPAPRCRDCDYPEAGVQAQDRMPQERMKPLMILHFQRFNKA